MVDQRAPASWPNSSEVVTAGATCPAAQQDNECRDCRQCWDPATLKLLNTENIEMFRHPNYYKELRKLRNKLDQVISKEPATAGNQRAPGPGPKHQAASHKPSVTKLSSIKRQASSPKQQASSLKPQATSSKLIHEPLQKVSSTLNQGALPR